MTDREKSTFRLSPEGKEYLERLAKDMGISQNAVIETLVRAEAKRRRIKLGAEIADEVARKK